MFLICIFNSRFHTWFIYIVLQFASMSKETISSKEQQSPLQALEGKCILEQTYSEPNQSNFKVGAQNTKEALTQIAEMREILSKEQSKLRDATEATVQILKDLQNQQRTVMDIELKVKTAARKCERLAEEIEVYKKEAEQQLQAVIPAQRRAQDALSSIDAATINELKSRRPHQSLKLILDAIAIYFNLKLTPIQINPSIQLQFVRGLRFTFWRNSFEESGRVILGPYFDFLRNLRNFDKNAINDQTIQLLQPLLEAEWFNQALLGRFSRVYAAFYRWITAVYQYYRKFQIVKQKMAKIALEERELQTTKETLVKAEEELTIFREKWKFFRVKVQTQLDIKNKLSSYVQNIKKNIACEQSFVDLLSI